MGAPNSLAHVAIVRRLGQVPYRQTVDAMQEFTAKRTRGTTDEFWWVEHPPVYTLGLKRRQETHPETLHGVPLAQTDRGGDITYHGPGQCVIYVLMDLERHGGGIRHLVSGIEQSVIGLLAQHGIKGDRRPGAPGVYVDNRKIAALGLRVRNGYTYHGMSLNVDLDLAPFARIHPCGLEGIESTSLAALGVTLPVDAIGESLLSCLLHELGYNAAR